MYEGVTFFTSYLVYLFVEYPFASLLTALTESVKAREGMNDDIPMEENNNSSKSVKDCTDEQRDDSGSSNNDNEPTTPTRVRRRSVSFVTRKSEERIIGGNIDVPKSIVDNE